MRRPGFWNKAEVKDVLRGTLEFLSEDYFDFELLAGKNAPTMVWRFPEPGTGSGNPKLFDLGKWSTLFVPSWRGLDLDGACLEGRGLAPDIEIRGRSW